MRPLIDKFVEGRLPPFSTCVPALFTESSKITKIQTLISRGGLASTEIVAIVTDDRRGFGEGWLSILHHAMYSEEGMPSDANMPSIVTPADSLEILDALLKSSDRSSNYIRIVLVDERVRRPTVAHFPSKFGNVYQETFLFLDFELLDIGYNCNGLYSHKQRVSYSIPYPWKNA